MPTAEIIAIGTELLLGEISDTNTAFIARELNKLGIDIFRTVIVGDNHKRITNQVKRSLAVVDIVITTGGLGPTVDDPTRQAVADVFGKRIVFQDQLWEQIQKRFRGFHKQPSENNRKQAYLPENAIAIENPVGTAPAFYIHSQGKTIISLPGVPAEMKYLISNSVCKLLAELHEIHSTTLSRIIHTVGIGESSLDSLIGDLERLKNPSVGITAKPGQVDIRITAKAQDAEAANTLIQPIQEKILNLVGNKVFGFNGETLLDSIFNLLKGDKVKLVLIIQSKDQKLQTQLDDLSLFTSIIKANDQNAKEMERIYSLYNNQNKQILIVNMHELSKQKPGYRVSIDFDNRNHTKELFFGGHEDLFHTWLINNLLNMIREIYKG